MIPAASRAVGPQSPDWLIWQLADSAFPTGGFAHSGGLESARQQGEVRNGSELLSFLKACLHQLGRSAMPLVAAAHAEPERLDEFDVLCDAFLSNHVTNRASRLQGKAFYSSVERVFRGRTKSGISPSMDDEGSRRREEADSNSNGAGFAPALRYAHFAPVFGALTRMLDIPAETARRLFFFTHLRGLLAAAVRLNLVGPMEAQSMQHRLAALADGILAASAQLTPEDLAQTSPLLDLWQGAQDRLYSRLFQS
jgi:urease accessory protein